MQDGAAAGERVGRRSRRGGDDEAVADVSVDVGAVDPGAHVDHASGFALGDDEVVERERGERLAAGFDLRGQQHAAFGAAAAGERVVDALDDLLGPDVGEEPEAATVDAEHGDVGHGGDAGSVQHRAVAADGHDEVRFERKLRLGHGLHTLDAVQGGSLIGRDLDGAAARDQVPGQYLHGLGDPRIGRAAGEGDTSAIGAALVHGWPAF